MSNSRLAVKETLGSSNFRIR